MLVFYERWLRVVSRWRAQPGALRVFFLTVTLFAWSYQPLMNLGMSSTAHLELSMPMIACMAFVILSIPRLISHWRIFVNDPWMAMLSISAAYSGISLLYSRNVARGIVLWAMVLLIVMVCASIIVWRKEIHAERQFLMYSAAVGVLASCVFAWFQIFSEALGAPSSITLLPPMYGSEVFGFARPTGWFAEPQFLANFLVIPLIYLLWLWLTTGKISRLQSGMAVYCSKARKEKCFLTVMVQIPDYCLPD